MSCAGDSRAPASIALFVLVASGCAGSVGTRSTLPDPDGAFQEVHLRLGDSTDVVLVGPERGIELLSVHDAYLDAMTPLDRSIRLHGQSPATEAALVASIAAAVRAFDASEVEILRRVFADITADLARLGLRLPLPSVIEVVTTTGREEVDAPIPLGYTRGQTIVLNTRSLARSPDALVRHELFHVLTRNAPALRDALYAVIGYRRVAPIVLPPALEARRLTNPDSPVAQHVIRVRSGGAEVQVANFLFANQPYIGGNVFRYMVPRLVEVDANGQVALDSGGAPRVLRIEDVEGYFEQVGRNTDYVIQPEEVLADNFAMLLLDGSVGHTPAPMDRMLTVLRASP